MRIADPYRRRAHDRGRRRRGEFWNVCLKRTWTGDPTRSRCRWGSWRARGDAASTVDRIRHRRCTRLRRGGRCAANRQQSPGTPGRVRVQHGAGAVLPCDFERRACNGDVATRGGRPRTVRGTARSRAAVVPVQSLVSPSGTAASSICDCSMCPCHRSTGPPLTRTRLRTPDACCRR